MAKLLVINPGSTSTKIGVVEDEKLLFEETLRHSTEEITQYGSIFEQKDFRKNIILDFLASKDLKPADFDASKKQLATVVIASSPATCP